MHHLGFTRSANRRDHLLLTPDTFVRTRLPGLIAGEAIVHTSPQAGAAFTMMTIEFQEGDYLSEGPAQRFLFVLEGHVDLGSNHANGPRELSSGGYAFFPAGMNYGVKATKGTRAVVIEKPFQRLDLHTTKAIEAHGEPLEPWLLSGNEADITPTALNGDAALQVRALLPSAFPFDFACNTMSYEPGASLSQVEVHYMEHGLLMLEGGGIYRLGDQWYPTQAGDFIWMAPYCPQWFCAVGKKPAKYLIYKDTNRHTIPAAK